MDTQKIAQAALVHYGRDAQLRMLQEECGELITVINQYERGRVDEGKVIEEIADVDFLIDQFKEFYGVEKIRAAKEFKANRQLERMENE